MILKNSTVKIWDLVNRFEEWASEKKGWNIIKSYDLIAVGNEYHKFFWTQNFHLQTFKKILQRQSCSLGEHLSYRTVSISYMAWILNETPQPIVWNLIKKTPCLSKRVAIYALNKAYSGMPNCLKLNETENIVLEEFEKFLTRKYGIELEPFFEKF